MNLTVKELNTDETHQAKHFLYEVYVNQLEWMPPKKNESKWHVYQDREGFFFDDMFNQRATWFGAFDQSRLVGSLRIFFPVNGHLELELFTELPLNYCSDSLIRVEANRLAIDEEYNGSQVLHFLRKAMIQFTWEKGVDFLFGGAPNRSNRKQMLDLGFKTVKSFSYSSDNSDISYAMVLDCRDRKRIEKIIQNMKNLKIRKLNFFD